MSLRVRFCAVIRGYIELVVNMVDQKLDPRDTEHQGPNTGRENDQNDEQSFGEGETLGEGTAISESEAARPNERQPPGRSD